MSESKEMDGLQYIKYQERLVKKLRSWTETTWSQLTRHMNYLELIRSQHSNKVDIPLIWAQFWQSEKGFVKTKQFDSLLKIIAQELKRII